MLNCQCSLVVCLGTCGEEWCCFWVKKEREPSDEVELLWAALEAKQQNFIVWAFSLETLYLWLLNIFTSGKLDISQYHNRGRLYQELSKLKSSQSYPSKIIQISSHCIVFSIFCVSMILPNPPWDVLGCKGTNKNKSRYKAGDITSLKNNMCKIYERWVHFFIPFHLLSTWFLYNLS